MLYYYDLCDSEDSYAVVETDLPQNDFEEKLDIYRKANEDEYNVDDFIAYMKDEGYTIRTLRIKEVYF